jgi:hypothetical protein
VIGVGGKEGYRHDDVLLYGGGYDRLTVSLIIIEKECELTNSE